MSDEQTFTISELAERAGVTPRTIRYYTAEGLLPAPSAEGKYARYNQNHLQRLRLIAELKAAYLPLHEIRAQIVPLDAAQVQSMLDVMVAKPSAPAVIAEQSSAAEYITNVMARQQMTRAQPASAAPVAAAPPAPVAAAPSSVRQRSGPLARLFPGRTEVASKPAEDLWQRITLAPGVELHLREPVSSAVQALAERTKRLFAGEEG